MYKSRFSDAQKQEILAERIESNLSVRAICEKHGITNQTFYTWKRRLENPVKLENEVKDAAPEVENRILRRLYIDLSAHNYELAKFLEK